MNAVGNGDGLAWRKSSYSGSDGGDCVEVAASHALIHVRDSKQLALAVLNFTSADWAVLAEAVGRSV